MFLLFGEKIADSLSLNFKSKYSTFLIKEIFLETLRIKLKTGYPSELAWQQLEAAGETVLFSSETAEGQCELYLKKTLFLKEYEFVDSIASVVLDDVNWDKQWQEHAPQFYNGMMHLDLNPYGCDEKLLLKPGPGFGDLSHVTTNLVLSMMPHDLKGKVVLDIGSGSGILTLAASAFGAYQTVGVEIDTSAIQHAEENAQLNHLEKRVQFLTPSQITLLEVSKPYLILMNMIVKEQKMAWKMIQLPKKAYGEAVTSGVLEEEKEAYLEITRSWGWELQEELSQDGWLGLRFIFGTRGL
ncbi:Ribosomal protein L11 methyltransferase [Chlamydiales bacterium STE3]|nr:Ribosomal protein L11 methyltransferase [Chlamydiales bacterium STE3]